ncbi:MAG: undecaprenyl-diphosphatase UppP [bacterium]
MSYLDAVILGILQGLTEFLPVSSSGHLVLGEAILGVRQSGVAFEVMVHLGTLAAVLVYFREPIGRLVQCLICSEMKAERRMLAYLAVGTIPAGLVGVLFKDHFEAMFDSPLAVSMMLFVTGGLLLSTRWIPGQRRELSVIAAIIIGCGQALAILPGISRSGSTIATGLWLGIEPSKAAEFSFLLAIPAIAGAAVLSLGDLGSLASSLWGPYLVGALVSFVVALGAVYLVLETVRRGKLSWFAYYCFAAGCLGLYLFV